MHHKRDNIRKFPFVSFKIRYQILSGKRTLTITNFIQLHNSAIYTQKASRLIDGKVDGTRVEHSASIITSLFSSKRFRKVSDHVALKILFLLLSYLHQKFTLSTPSNVSLCHTNFQQTENCQIHLLPADKVLEARFSNLISLY